MSDTLGLLRGLAHSPSTIAPPRANALNARNSEINFAQLLQKAQAGELTSGMTVRPAPSCGVELSPVQLARLSAAADRAEAQGATRAVALIDGQALHLDVPTRTVLGKADLTPGNTLTNIDAVFVVPDEHAAAASPTKPPSNDLSKLSPSLLKVLRDSPSNAGA